jgi:hypothetical protein
VGWVSWVMADVGLVWFEMIWRNMEDSAVRIRFYNFHLVDEGSHIRSFGTDKCIQNQGLELSVPVRGGDDNDVERRQSIQSGIFFGSSACSSQKPCSQNTSTIWIGRRSDETSKQHSSHYFAANSVTLSYTTRNEHLSPNELHQSEREPTLLRYT